MGYIYIYHIPNLNAVKIGKGENPFGRMLDYAKLHALDVDAESLAFWDVGKRADKVERWLHRAVNMPKVNVGKTNEVFSLNGFAFPEAKTRIRDLLATNPIRPVGEPPIVDYPSNEAIVDTVRQLSDRLKFNNYWALVHSFLRSIDDLDVNGSEHFVPVALVHKYPRFTEGLLGHVITVEGQRVQQTEKLTHPQVYDYLVARDGQASATADPLAAILEAIQRRGEARPDTLGPNSSSLYMGGDIHTGFLTVLSSWIASKRLRRYLWDFGDYAADDPSVDAFVAEWMKTSRLFVKNGGMSGWR